MFDSELFKAPQPIFVPRLTNPVVRKPTGVKRKKFMPMFGSEPQTEYKGTIIDPLDGMGKITSYHLDNRTKIGLGINNGIDLAINKGTSIKSMIDGKVIDVAYHKGGYGNLITVERSDGMQYVYAHMDKKSPYKIGDSVKAGDKIGEVGRSGLATGNHLSLQIGKGQFNKKTLRYITGEQAKNEPGKAINPLSELPNRK